MAADEWCDSTGPHCLERCEAGLDLPEVVPSHYRPMEESLIVNGVSFELVGIPPGRFQMGSEAGAARGHVNQLPVHQVEITEGFLAGQFPVTQSQWSSLGFSNPSAVPGDNLPVHGITWDEATEFCEHLAKRSSRPVRLPSEAEWEYLCRAGTCSEYFFGEDDADLDQFAWYEGNSQDRLHPVGEKKPNPWGLHDVVGNIWEWCADVWQSDYEGAPGDGTPRTDRAEEQPRRVLRGASYDMDSFRCRSAYRSFEWKDFGLPRAGLRIVIGPDRSPWCRPE